MPIVDIAPVGSKIYDRSAKITPVYLVVAEDTTTKSKVQKYLAIKLDELQFTVKFVGLEINENENELIKKYQEMLNSADKGIYKEMQLPWQRIIRIQNLIFKQK